MREGLHGSRLHFPDLSIQGYRGINDLSIPQLGRVTLITGKNNTGKSSVLEGLRLHAQNATPQVIRSVLAFREEFNRSGDEEERASDQDSPFTVSTLFNGYPLLSDKFAPVTILTSGKVHPMKLTMRVGWFSEEPDSEVNRRLVSKEGEFLGETEDVAALVVETEEGRRVHRLESFLRPGSPTRRFPQRHQDRSRMSCVLVSSFSGEGTNLLGSLWDDVVLADRQEDMIKALHIIDPRITSVNMVGGDGPSRNRTAVVSAKNIARPVPLRSFGDGLNRLFAIILSLVNARGGILLIDEFENGLHYSVQLDAWHTVFRLAQILDVQVFATSHSWDTIATFQEAASQTPEDGVLVRLTRRGDTIFPTVFAEHELAVVTRDKIEVR